MYQLGQHFISGNPEDMMNLRKDIITDVMEVSLEETFYEVTSFVILRGTVNTSICIFHGIN